LSGAAGSVVVSQTASILLGGECDHRCFTWTEVCRLPDPRRTVLYFSVDRVRLQKRVRRVFDTHRIRVPFILASLDNLFVDRCRDDDSVEQFLK
jgi:hypothetical protein